MSMNETKTDQIQPFPDERYVTIDYTNHRGERAIRKIHPLCAYWGDNEWHTTPQWLLAAHDCQSGKWRTFAIKDIHSWLPVEPTNEQSSPQAETPPA